MNRILGSLIILLAAAASVAGEPFSKEEQIQLITAYGYVTGQLHNPATAENAARHIPPDKCGTNTVCEFANNYSRLDPALLKSLGVSLVTRPTLSNAYASPAGRFLIHYATAGADAVYQSSVRTLVDSVPDYVVMIARIADSVYTHEIDTLGYNPPPRDDGYPQGGDSLYDIYVVNLPPDVYGLTYPDFIYPLDTTATSFLEIDNDYQDIDPYINRPLDAVRVTVAHEFFHAIQFGMDYSEADNPQSQTLRKQYWMEMSAVWMEEEVYDKINDYYAYLPYFLGCPTVSLQEFGSNVTPLHEYGSVLFPLYLSQKFGRAIIRDIWNRCAETKGPNFIPACELAINAVDPESRLSTAMGEFAVWNYFTGGYASAAPAGVGYKERAAYPLIPADSMLNVDKYPNRDQSSITTGAFRPQYNGTAYLLLQEMNTRDTCYLIDSIGDSIVWVPCDSVLPIKVFVQHPDLVEWAISIISQPLDPVKPFQIQRIVSPKEGSGGVSEVDVYCYHPNEYRSIAITVSASTNIEDEYLTYTAPLVGYVFSDSGGIVGRSTNAVLTPYPNPAAVASMGGRPMTFRFQVTSDSTNSNAVTNPLLLVDIYSTAGAYVRSISTSFENADRLHGGGLFETTWDMKNQGGKDVASGAYLVYARLWDSPQKGKLLAESKSKVAVIR